MSAAVQIPISIPAPHVQPIEGQISRIMAPDDTSFVDTGTMCTETTRQKWSERLEDEPVTRRTLGAFSTKPSKTRRLVEEDDLFSTQRLRPSQELPPLPPRRAFPQTFQESILMARPKHWPQWWDMDWDYDLVDDEEDADVPSLAQQRVRQRSKLDVSASCPDLHAAKAWDSERAKKEFMLNGDPESLLSPFALQARRHGADLLLTGQKLRPDTGKMFQLPSQGPRPRAPSTAEPTPRSESKMSARANSAGNLSMPKTGNQAVAKAKRLAQSGRRPRSVGEKSVCIRRGGSQVSSASWQSSNAPLALLQGAKSPPAERDPSKPKLSPGPAGMWDKSTKLLAVRDILDGYAADPLGVRPGSSAGFLEKYVERQVEIERLLRERQGDSGAGGPGGVGTS